MNPVKINNAQVTRLYKYGNYHFYAADLIHRKLFKHIPMDEHKFPLASLSLAMYHIEFGIELKFKYLHIQEHAMFMPIHDLKILFKGGTGKNNQCKGLSKDTQHQIDSAFQHVTGMKFLEFHETYRDIWNQRYIFAEEKHEQVLSVNFYIPLKDKLNEILESVRTIPLTKSSETLSVRNPLEPKVEDGKLKKIIIHLPKNPKEETQ